MMSSRCCHSLITGFEYKISNDKDTKHKNTSKYLKIWTFQGQLIPSHFTYMLFCSTYPSSASSLNITEASC